MAVVPKRQRDMSLVTGRSVVAALLAVVVIVLTLIGALDNVPVLLRGSAQALGTLAGVYLGARLQAHDDRTSIAGAANSALANLVALAESIKLLIATSESFRERTVTSTPQTVAAFQHTSESLLAGIDNQARMLLTQAQAAATVWVPYARHSGPFGYPQTEEEGASDD